MNLMYECGYDVNIISKKEVEVATFYQPCLCDNNCNYRDEYCPKLLNRDEQGLEFI